MFDSEFRSCTTLQLPEFRSTRVVMKPVRIADPESLGPKLAHYHDLFARMCGYACISTYGHTGYLTIDEQLVAAGECHRRPGLRVGGWFPYLQNYVWDVSRAHARGSWNARGSFVLSSHANNAAWRQRFIPGIPAEDGSCTNLGPLLRDDKRHDLLGSNLYWLDDGCIHQSLPESDKGLRQFVCLHMTNTGDVS